MVGVGGALLQRRGLKPHFFGTYLNIVANVLFWAVLSGVFDRQGYGLWFLALLIACGASLAWGLTRRQFAFVAYAAVYGYVGVSSMLLRSISDDTAVLSYFVVTGSRHARGAGPDRAPLREAGMRIYSASSEETLRARKLLKDWAGEGFLTKTQYQRLEQETVSDLRTTNIFLRLVLFLFTLIIVGAAAALFFVVFLSRPSEQTTGIFFLIFAAVCYAAAEVRRFPSPALSLRDRGSARRLLGWFSLRGNAGRSFQRQPLFAEAERHPRPWFPPPAPSFRSGYGAASGSGMHFSPR